MTSPAAAPSQPDATSPGALRPAAVVVLAAGLGTRMKSARPKVMQPLAGRPMVNHVLDTCHAAGIGRAVVVVGPDMPALVKAVAPAPTVVQAERLGTAHAVLQARAALADFAGDIIVLFGDVPLITADTLATLRARHAGPDAPAVTVLGFRPADPARYGRLVLGADGALERIVEFKEANAAERAIGLCNGGPLIADRALLFDLLAQVRNDNAKGEYYLTDLVALARASGRRCAYAEAPEAELIGADDRAALARAEAVVQDRLRAAAMASGATLTAPGTVFLCWDTAIGRDVTIAPNVVFGPGVRVEEGAEIRAFCHLEGCTVAAGAIIGPFARLRPGAEIGPEAHIGNFVEVKNARIEAGAKANHLAYIGDARVGARANIGAGTITCNYDGFDKHHTDIGAGAFIGSNTALVAPVSVGDGAIVGAGSVVARNVPADALAVTRAPHEERAGWAASFRKHKAARKARRKSTQ